MPRPLSVVTPPWPMDNPGDKSEDIQRMSDRRPEDESGARAQPLRRGARPVDKPELIHARS